MCSLFLDSQGTATTLQQSSQEEGQEDVGAVNREHYVTCGLHKLAFMTSNGMSP